MSVFILVSGSWHAGWCWTRVTPLLEQLGHRVIAPDLAGMGEDPTSHSTVTLEMWADQIAGLIQLEDEPVVLVGHSRGGIIISEAAERVPDRIECLVYLAGLLIPDGESVADVRAEMAKMDSGRRLEASLTLGPGNTTILDPAIVKHVFFNTTPEEWADYGARNIGPEPMAALSAPLSLSQDRFGRVRRAYIECARDNAVPLELQRAMQDALPCDPVFTLDTDHSPFLSDPSALVDILDAISRQRRNTGR